MRFSLLSLPLAGLSVTSFVLKRTKRRRLFKSYQGCSKTTTAFLLAEFQVVDRIRQLYGSELAYEARNPRNVEAIKEVLYKKSTLRDWFADPMRLFYKASSMRA